MGTYLIKPPIGGIVRSSSYQDQPPFTCYDSVNIFPFDALDGHDAVATRPPLVAVTSPGFPVNAVARLNLPSPTLFSAANGKLYKRDNNAGTWAQITSSVGVTAGRWVETVPYIKRLFILNDDTPLVYDDEAGTLIEWVATVGTVPSGARIGAVYEGAIWLAVDNQLSCCRTTNPFDWDFSVSDTGGAVAATANALGQLLEPITALVPLQGRMLISTESTLFLMTGHPRRGGRIDQIHDSVGILGPRAWCRSTKGRDVIFFTSKIGTHATETDSIRADVVALPISKKKIPEELINLPFDADDPTISMAFDQRWDGVITTVRGDREQAWWYDTKNGGFSRFTCGEYPMGLFSFEGFMSEDTSGVLFAGSGYSGLARMDRTGSEALPEVFILMGPANMAESTRFASMINRADFVIGGRSTDLNAVFSFHTGHNGQIATIRAQTDQPVRRFDVTAETLLNNHGVCYPKLSGSAVVLRMEQPAGTTQRIVFDGVALDLKEGLANHDSGVVPPILTSPDTSFATGTD